MDGARREGAGALHESLHNAGWRYESYYREIMVRILTGGGRMVGEKDVRLDVDVEWISLYGC